MPSPVQHPDPNDPRETASPLLWLIMLFLLLSPLLVRLLPKELQKEITILFRHR